MNHSNIRKSDIIRMIALAAIMAIAFSVYQAAVIKNGNFDQMRSIRFGIGRKTIVFWIISFALVLFCKFLGSKRLFKYRYQLAGIAFIISVLFELTGSSIGMYAQYFGEPETNLLAGMSRGIRSDEWATYTPMTWAQYYDPKGSFPYFSSVIRAAETDVFLVYGLPVSSWLMIFKPFLIGYLFLPIGMGMAFFWSGRFIALFLSSFEFGRMITSDNRKLSLAYAVLVTFSPAVQWWFAINSFVEMLVFSQVSLLCFNQYLKTKVFYKRTIYALAIAVCAGGYVLTMYPAWMIPLAYVILACIIWLAVKHVREKTFIKINIKDCIVLAICVLFLAGAAYDVFRHSAGTVGLVNETVYPGKRVSTGGGGYGSIFEYSSNLWSVFLDSAPYANQCETATFFSLFPLGLLIWLRNILKRKTRDLLSALSVLIIAALQIYCITGVPELLSRITLLGHSLSSRAVVIFAFANVILLFRGLAVMAQEEKVGKSTLLFSLILSAGISLFIILTNQRMNPAFYSAAMLIFEGIVVMLLLFGGLAMNKKIIKGWTGLVIAICLISGTLVNPVRKGISDIQEIAPLKMVKQIVQTDPEAKWVVEGMGFPMNNSLLLTGARTVNCTNVYPSLERWEIIDEEGEYKDVYNRYAHISMEVVEPGYTGEKFRLLNPDYFHVGLSIEELRKLDIKYLFTRKDFTGNEQFKLISSIKGYSVYELNP